MSLQSCLTNGRFVFLCITLAATSFGLAPPEASAADPGATRSAPVVTLVAPDDNAIFEPGVVTFECDASDDTGLESLTLYLDGNPVETETLSELCVHLNENLSTEPDSSGNGRDGTVVGAVYTSDGKIGGAYSFDGLSQHIKLDTAPTDDYGFSGQSGASMAAWVRPAAGQTALSGSIVYIDRGVLTSTRMLISVNSNLTVSVKGRCSAESSGVPTVTTNLADGTVPIGVWSHVVGVIDLSTNPRVGRIYINGVLKKEGEPSPLWATGCTAFATSYPLEPGIGAVPGTPNTYSFKGDIDEVGVFNRVLTLEEAQALYNGVYYNSWSSSFEVTMGETGTYTWNCQAEDIVGEIGSGTERTLLISLCGNGELDAGEDCDPGQAADGDCCAPDCQFDVENTPCTDDGNPCTFDVCDVNGTCTHPNHPLLPDADEDLVPDSCDNCPLVFQLSQGDCNDDGQGDACETEEAERDADNDGLCNPSDNCPFEYNPGQEDADQNGIGDPCECYPSVKPLPEPTIPDANFGTRVRYLAFSAGTAGLQQGIRVTFTNLPPPFDYAEGRAMWVGEPRVVSEFAGLTDLTPPTIKVAQLQCELFATDWTQHGTVYVRDDGLLPRGQYSVQAIGKYCPPEESSDPLLITLSQWGDAVGNAFDKSPNGQVNFDDIAAVVDKFTNAVGSPAKSRADISPGMPDLIVDFADISLVVDAFQGGQYPYGGPPATDPCN